MAMNLEIGVRFGIDFGIVLALLVAISITYTRASTLHEEDGNLMNDKYPKTAATTGGTGADLGPFALSQ